MSIRIKVATEAREIDDALWLRHEVFVNEDHKFGGKPVHGGRLVDRFDAFPNAYHVVAYEGTEPVATMRLLKDSDAGMPVDELYDFTAYRRQVGATEPAANGSGMPRVQFGSAGMLAIRSQWRRRRDVIRAMFRMAATVCRRYGATHILVVVNHETAGMYRRLGFVPLTQERIWNEEIGNHVVPLVGTTAQFLEWAFRGLQNAALSDFQDSFERMVLRAGEHVFREGERGEHAYIVESGDIRIARNRASGEELTLAHLGRGDLLGELALIDDQPRSASAIAMVDTELMTLDRHTFQTELQANPERAQSLFRIFSARVRAMDELAMVLAFAPAGQRLEFALDIARQQASPDASQPGAIVFKGGPRELALLAAVEEGAALAFLETAAGSGGISFGPRHIQFQT